MRISKYHSQLDEKFLEAMLTDRVLAKELVKTLPQVGFIVFEGDRPIAAGFLRDCEKGIGMLDSYITSPGELAELRNSALDLITERLIAESERMGMIRLLAFSENQNIIIRAMKHGFVATPHIMTIRKVG